MEDIDCCARLNNQAISLLLVGDNPRAVAILNKALNSIKKMLASHRSNIPGATCSCECHESFILPSFGDRDCSIYNQAISFSTDKLPSTIDALAHVCSAVIMFNMALAHHRVGLIASKKTCSNRAISLYNLTLRLLKNYGFGGTAGVVKLASMNNLLQLRYERGEYALARQGLEFLSAGLKQVAKTGQSKLKDSGLQGLITNILFLKNQRVAPAA
jgi:hypothetical protein